MSQLSPTGDTAPPPFYKREVAAWITALITAGATVMSAIVTVALTTASQHNEGSLGTPPDPPHVTIQQPERDVARNFTSKAVPMTGTSSGIRPGEVIWAFVEQAGSGVFYPNQTPCRLNGATGIWNCTVYVGQIVDSGTYVVHMVVANSVAQANIIDYWVGCQSHDCFGLNLPSGTNDLAQIEIHRRS